MRRGSCAAAAKGAVLPTARRAGLAQVGHVEDRYRFSRAQNGDARYVAHANQWLAQALYQHVLLFENLIHDQSEQSVAHRGDGDEQHFVLVFALNGGNLQEICQAHEWNQCAVQVEDIAIIHRFYIAGMNAHHPRKASLGYCDNRFAHFKKNACECSDPSPAATCGRLCLE